MDNIGDWGLLLIVLLVIASGYVGTKMILKDEEDKIGKWKN